MRKQGSSLCALQYTVEQECPSEDDVLLRFDRRGDSCLDSDKYRTLVFPHLHVVELPA